MRNALRDQQQWVKRTPGLLWCSPSERANCEAHVLAVAVHDERFLAANWMARQRAVCEPDPIRFVNYGHDLDWLDNGDAGRSGRDGHALTTGHRSGPVHRESAGRLYSPSENIPSGVLPHRLAAAYDGRHFGSAVLAVACRPIVKLRMRHGVPFPRAVGR